MVCHGLPGRRARHDRQRPGPDIGLCTEGRDPPRRSEQFKVKHEVISDVRNLGLLACVELVSDGATRAPLSASFSHGENIDWFKRRMLELGQEVRVSDHFILIDPPLSITAEEITWAMTMLDELLGEVDDRLKAA